MTGKSSHRPAGTFLPGSRLLTVGGAALGALLLVSCSSARKPAQGGAGASTYLILMGVIPDTPETRQRVTMTNYARWRELVHVSPPADPTDKGQKEAYLQALAAAAPSDLPPTFVSGQGRFAAALSLETYLGYRRVDQDVMAGVPPQRYEAVRGEFDPQTARKQIAGCGDCPAADTATFEGVTYYSWGEDLQLDLRHRLSPPAFDELGRGGRVAIDKAFVFRTVWTDGITGMIAAWHGKGSLAKNEAFGLAAEGLDELGTYTAFISDRTQSPQRAQEALDTGIDAAGRAQFQAAWFPAAGAPILRPYTALATGVGRDSTGQPYTGIVLVHTTAQAARDNAALLRRRIAETVSLRTGSPWSSRFTSVEVRVKGRVLEATLHGSGIGAAFVFQNDPLLLHQ